MKAIRFIMVLLLPVLAYAQESDTLYIYGPGGPFGPINECAQLFGNQSKIVVKVTAGPESNWIQSALKNADIIYGGAEYMLTHFSMKHSGLVDNSTRTELYKRGAAILVRPGNPKRIMTLKDLTKTGVHILDINGAGQFGLWEDLAGKQNLIAGIQHNIKKSFENTALGITAWESDTAYNAWITYGSWHYRLKEVTQLIKIPAAMNVYRGTPVALTTITRKKQMASRFIQFMQSQQGHRIFQKWGWE